MVRPLEERAVVPLAEELERTALPEAELLERTVLPEAVLLERVVELPMLKEEPDAERAVLLAVEPEERTVEPEELERTVLPLERDTEPPE